MVTNTVWPPVELGGGRGKNRRCSLAHIGNRTGIHLEAAEDTFGTGQEYIWRQAGIHREADRDTFGDSRGTKKLSTGGKNHAILNICRTCM